MSFKINFLISAIIASCFNISSMFNVDKTFSINSQYPPNIYKVDQYKLLVALPDNNIYLYAMDWKKSEIEHTGVYKNILLDLNSKKRHFHWTIDTNPAFKPQLILSDINKDGVKELIVIITSASGTGVNIQQIFIFNPYTFSEVFALDPLKVIAQNVNTQITKNNGNVNIKINVKGNIFTTIARESAAGLWADDVIFGNHINYDVKNNKIIAKIGAQVSVSLYVGKIIIDYAFKNKNMEVTRIVFKKFENQNVFD